MKLALCRALELKIAAINAFARSSAWFLTGESCQGLPFKMRCCLQCNPNMVENMEVDCGHSVLMKNNAAGLKFQGGFRHFCFYEPNTRKTQKYPHQICMCSHQYDITYCICIYLMIVSKNENIVIAFS